jgi:hypothetical protein
LPLETVESVWLCTLAPTVAICEKDPDVPKARSTLKPVSLLDASFHFRIKPAASEISDQRITEENPTIVTSNASREKRLADFISSTSNGYSFCAFHDLQHEKRY